MFVFKLLLWIIAYTAGIIRLSFAIVRLVQNRREKEFWTASFMLVFALLILALSGYDTMLQVHFYKGLFLGDVAAYCAALFILIIPLNIHHVVTGISHFQLRNGIFVGLSFFSVLILSVQYLFKSFNLFRSVLFLVIILMSSSIIYSMFVLIKYKTAKTSKTGKYFPIVVIILVPLMVIVDFIINNTQNFIVLPVLYLILNVLWIVDETGKSVSAAADRQLSQEKMLSLDLTEREQDVVECLLGGLTYKQTAEKLFISVQTVKTHANRIYTKTGCSNKMELLNKLA